MPKAKIKTMEITGKEWAIDNKIFFEASIVINKDLKTQKEIKVPYQLGGVSEHTKQAIFKSLQKNGWFSKENSNDFSEVYKANDINDQYYFTAMGVVPDIKTIDIECREYWDKQNGNSYFAGTITINFGTSEERCFAIGFQYGYGSHYEHMAFELLRKFGYFADEKNNVPRIICEKNNISYRHSITDGATEKELKTLGNEEY